MTKKVTISQKLLRRKLQILRSLYSHNDMGSHLFSPHLLFQNLPLSLSLLVKEMASSKLVAFLAVLVVLLPMSALGANNTDPFLGISTLFFVLLADCFGCHIHMNMLHISVRFDLLTQKDHKINPINTHNNVFFFFGFELQQGCVKKWNVERELA